MQIRLKPYHKNLYPVNSLFIKGETVQEWISHICRLHIDLEQVEAYAVPGIKANTLYGCVLFFKRLPLPKDIQQHQYLQYAANKLLLPEQSMYLPAIDEEELKAVAPGKKILLHPVVGCVILTEPVDWTALLEFKDAASLSSQKPVAGVRVPGSIHSFTLELSDEKLMQDLLNPPSEKEALENLPFDIKKLMKGNKREMEKYLKYLEAHPDKALNIALPLDTLGSFRGDNKGRFSFSGNWLQGLFGSGSNSSGSRGNYSTGSGTGNFWWIGVFVVAFVKIMTCNTTPQSNDYSNLRTSIVFEKKQTVLDSHYNSIMASKNMKLLMRLKKINDSGGNAKADYKLEQKKLQDAGRQIKDSLTAIYITIVQRKTDSVMKVWKKTAGDSIRKTGTHSSFQKGMQEAVLAKRESTYREYGLYYGIIEDNYYSNIKDNPVAETPARDHNPPETQTTRNKKSMGFMLLLAGVLVAVSLLLVYWRKPQTAKTALNDMSLGRILLLLTIMTGSIIYILKPLIEIFGFGWLSIGVCMLLVLLLYRLFAGGLTIFNFKKDN